jgi:hypothetical protein
LTIGEGQDDEWNGRVRQRFGTAAAILAASAKVALPVIKKCPSETFAATSVALRNVDLAETSIDLGQFPSDRTSS